MSRLIDETNKRKEVKIMKREKTNLYEEVNLNNDWAYAAQVKEEAETMLENTQKVWTISIIGSVCGGVGFLLAFNPILILIAIVIAIICYRRVGGLVMAGRWAMKIGKIGWFVFPYFPIDIAIGTGAFTVGLLTLFFMPFFVVRHQKEQALLTIEQVERFLNAC